MLLFHPPDPMLALSALAGMVMVSLTLTTIGYLIRRICAR